MPDEAGRETYPAAPTRGGRMNTPMPEADAPGASSPPDAPAAPSAEPVPSPEPVSEQAPPPPSQPEPEKPFHMPPPERWEEVRKQRDDAERRAQQAEALAQLALQKLQVPTAPPLPADDHWKGLVDHPDPATAQFYQQQRVLFQKEAERMADLKLQGVMQAVDAGRRELAGIKIAQFRKENPGIIPGSPEENAIASYVQQGFDLESAKKLALFDTLDAENKALKAKSSARTAALPQKTAANVEAGTGMPDTAGLPGKRLSAADRAAQVYDASGGNISQVLKAMFHNKRG